MILWHQLTSEDRTIAYRSAQALWMISDSMKEADYLAARWARMSPHGLDHRAIVSYQTRGHDYREFKL